MPSMFIFRCLKLKRRSCKIPFPKSIVYNDVLLEKLGQSCKSFFPSKNAERETLKDAEEHSCRQVLKFSRPLNYSKLSRSEIESCLSKKFQEKHGNHWMTMQSTIKVINWPYKFMSDKLSIL